MLNRLNTLKMAKQLYLFCFSMLLALAGAAQDPDIADNERSAFEEFFRSSEQPGETPVNARQRRGHTKRVSVPAGAARIGCVCMDETSSAARSIGACSGHGGVRYWLYRTREGDTVRVLTARHEFHPHPLDSVERSELAPPKKQPARRDAGVQPVVVVVQPAAPAGETRDGDVDWPEALGIGAGSFAALLAMRMLLNWAEKQSPLIRDALFDLLRSRKRPAARKNRKSARPPRL